MRSGGFTLLEILIVVMILGLLVSMVAPRIIGRADEARTNIVKAFVVLRNSSGGDDALVEELQNFVKSRIAPYKYPRAIEFVDQLPKTGTGKVQRFRLREIERDKAAGR